MSHKLDVEVSFYPSIRNGVPERRNLYELLRSGQFKGTIAALRNENEQEQRKRIKNTLPAFTPSGIFSGANADSLVSHTGLICIDIDHKDNTHLTDFDQLKEHIHLVPYVLYCGLSASGRGYFCIVAIQYPHLHKQHFQSLNEDFKRCGITIDQSCSDIARKRFVSLDEAPYINLEAQVYTRTTQPQPASCKPQQSHGSYNDKDIATARKITFAIQDAQIDITEDYGNWFGICCALANTCGEEGRELFHTISQFHPKYEPVEADKKYNDALAHRYNYTLGTLVCLAQKFGVSSG